MLNGEPGRVLVVDIDETHFERRVPADQHRGKVVTIEQFDQRFIDLTRNHHDAIEVASADHAIEQALGAFAALARFEQEHELLLGAIGGGGDALDDQLEKAVAEHPLDGAGNQQSDDAGPAGGERSGGSVREIVLFGDDALYPGAHRIADPGVVIDHAGNRGA